MTGSNRRRNATTLALLALLAALLGGLVLWLRPPVRAEAEFLVFGSRARIDLRANSREQADAALSEAGRLLAHNHRAWHAWEPSELTRLNRDLAEGRARRMPADIAAMIVQARRGYDLSDGLFNPATGKLIDAWGFHTSDYPVRAPAPAQAQVERLVSTRPSMDAIHVTADGTVSSDNPAIALDLNGLAEGYAAVQVRRLLEAHGINDGLIYIGGFVLAMGRDDARPWRVGIDGPAAMLGTLELGDGEAIASSGDYQRHRADGDGHIIDPRAGRPQRASAAASVVSDDPVLADMAATALMVAGPEGMDQLARQMRLSCMLLLAHDGTLHISPALQARLRLDATTAPLRVHDIDGDGCRRDPGTESTVTVALPEQFRH